MVAANTAIADIEDPIDLETLGFPRTPEADMALYIKGFFHTHIMLLRQLLDMKGGNIPASDRKRIEDAIDRIQLDVPIACNGVARNMKPPGKQLRN